MPDVSIGHVTFSAIAVMKHLFCTRIRSNNHQTYYSLSKYKKGKYGWPVRLANSSAKGGANEGHALTHTHYGLAGTSA